MRKILFALAASLFIATSYADLGAIAVSSFLNQRLSATIPINAFGSKVDYNNFAVDLAGKDKFQQSGISFNPELASLNFTVMKTNRGNVIKISSSRPIKSPVLSFVLHYQVNSNDFYRQYTILLDPLEYSADNSGVINSEPNRDNRVIIARNDNTSYRPSVKPIPIARAKSIAKSPVVAPSVSFDADFNNNYVRQHLSQFNQSSFSYTTVKNDTIYSIAKFEQSLYPKADLSLNQIIIALAMENYRDLRPLSYLYESGAEIFLPEAKDIALIPSDAADNYLLNTQLTNPQKITLLTQIAAKFNSNLEIDSPNLFSDVNPMLNVVKQRAPAKIKQEVAAEAKPVSPILDILFEYKYYILSVLFSLGLILVFRARAKKTRQMVDNIIPLQFSNPQYIDPVDEANIAALDDSHFTIDSIIPVHLQEPETSAVNKTSTSREIPIADKLPDLNMEPSLTPEPVITAAVESVSSMLLDDELVNTLEQILTFDDGRDDIRLKLFELYLSAKNITKADTFYDSLNRNLDSDDPVRKTLAEICTRYNYDPDNLQKSVEITSSVNSAELNLNIGESISEQALVETAMVNEEDINHQMDYSQINPITSPLQDNLFIIAPPLDEEDISRTLDFNNNVNLKSTPTATNAVEAIDFAAERVMDFGDISLSNPEVIVSPDFGHVLASSSEFNSHEELVDPHDVEYEEKLNLSRMYYHIDEHQKARELLLDMKQNMDLPDKFKTQVNQLLADLGLDG